MKILTTLHCHCLWCWKTAETGVTSASVPLWNQQCFYFYTCSTNCKN